MLQHIISFSVRNKLIVGLLTIALVIYGVIEATRLPIDAVPDITDNQVQVITVSPSLGAPDIERLITFPIEQANSNIPGLKEIRSFSRFGLSLVTIVFEDNVDVYWARQQVSERLQQVSSLLPNGMGTPELAPVTTGLGEIYQYVIRTKPGYEGKYSLQELRTIQDWIVRRQLLGTPGVADVSSFGGKLKQYEVAVKPDRLLAHQLTIDDVFSALEKNNSNAGGAYIEKGPSVLYIRTEGVANEVNDLGWIVVKTLDNGTPLLLRDIAEVRIGEAIRYGAMCYNDQGEVSGAVVMMLKGANSSEVIANVKAKVAEISKTLPDGVVIEPFLDRTKMVNNAIGTVEKNLLEGALIVLFVLIVFLGNARAGLLVASVIPLSMLFAIIMMNMFGVSGNLMSLGALDFGLIVDGAVIIVEAVMHKLAHSKYSSAKKELSKNEMDQTVQSSASRMMNAAVFGQIIILIVYLPILTLQGIEGKMFKPMAQTVAFALLGAFILSLTYVPMMSAWTLSRKTEHKPNLSDRIMARIENAYTRMFQKALVVPKSIVIAVLGLFALSLVLMGTLGGEFIPELEEGDFAVDTRVLTGSNLNTTIEATQKTASVLLSQFPEVEKVVTKIGSGEIPTDPMPMEASDMMVILKDKSEWTSAKTFDELAEKMSAKLSDVPGVTAGFQFPVQMRFNELMTGARQDVVCKIFGENLDELSAKAEELASQIGGIEGAKDLYVETITGMPQVVIKPKRDMLAAYGVDIATVNNTVNAAFAGKAAGQMFEDEKRFDLVVRMAETNRDQVSDIQNLNIHTSSGEMVPLRALADIQVIDGPNQIQREDAKRRIVVGFNVRGRDIESVVTELRQKVEGQIKFKEGYYVTYGGSFENMQAAQKRLSIALPIALALIFLMLYFAFNSMREGLVIFSAIPLSAIGGVIALAARGLPFSISAGVGFIALFGVAVLNGIVLISEFNRLRQDGLHDLNQILIQGTRSRLRPVLMTAAVASLGFFPMAFSHGAGAEVQRPLATVVIGGLISATFLTLFVIPILFRWAEGKKKKKLNHSTLVIVAVVCFLQFPQHSYAQLPAGLESALSRTESVYPMIQSSKARVTAYETMAQSTWQFDRTAFAMEWGQFNSSQTDNKFSVSQSFKLPGYYQSAKEQRQIEADISKEQQNFTTQDARKQVASLYYDFQVVKQILEMLDYSDSLYGAFVKMAEWKLKQGATSAMELQWALIRQNEIQVRKMEWQLQRDFIAEEWMYFTQSDTSMLNMDPSSEWLLVESYDSTSIYRHPQFKAASFSKEWYDRDLQIAKWNRVPDVSLGYNNMSLKGFENVNGNDVLRTGSDRFQWMSVGLQLPLFSNYDRKSIQAKEKMVLAADWDVKQQGILLMKDYNQAWINYTRASSSYNESKSTLLPAVNALFQLANAQLISGDIDGTQWIQSVQQATEARLLFYQRLRTYNQAAIQFHYSQF